MHIQNCIVPLQIGCGCGGLACSCQNKVRTKCGACPKCGAPIYEVSQVTYQWWGYNHSKPQIEYSCACRFDYCAPCIPAIPLKITVEYQPRKLSKKRSGKEW